MKAYLKLILAMVLYLGISNDCYPIVKGYFSGEIYFSSTWYWINIGERYNAIFFSDDHGETLSIKFICDIDAGDMNPMLLFRDATQGTFYNAQATKLWRSQDYCSSWDEVLPATTYSSYSSGIIPGEVYSVWTNEALSRVELWRSLDYGETYQIVNENISGRCEVGTEPGEIYHYHLWQEDSVNLSINLSADSGNSFNISYNHDTSVSGISLMGHYPIIYHGVEPGELYLVSWHLPENFKIFHSNDYGNNFYLMFVSPICDFYYESYSFTPGVDQGEFYYIKGLPWFDDINTKVYIYYSRDTARTFTEHIHILDSTFPVKIYDNDKIKRRQVNITNYPNPFKAWTTLCFDISQADYYTIEFSNLSGQIVLRKKEYYNQGAATSNLTTEQLRPGIYICTLRQNDNILGVKKVIRGS